MIFAIASNRKFCSDQPILQTLPRKEETMNWDAIGALYEAIGALAVVITLLYLAIQIKEQTKETRLTATVICHATIVKWWVQLLQTRRYLIGT